MDDPIMLGIIAVAVLAVLGIVFLKGKQKPQADKKGRKLSSARSSRHAEVDDEDDDSAETTEHDNMDWDTVATTNVVDDTKVSVQDVDALTEFNVYKQFGYFDKAAESLSAYLAKTPKRDPELAGELVELWLQAKNVDAATEALTQYQDTLSEEQITQFVKEGLAIDENHLGLRVLAENKAGLER